MDCLSRYYEDGGGESVSKGDIDWANADVGLDPEGDDLPHDRWQELCLGTMRAKGNTLMGKLTEQKEACRIEAEEMATNAERSKGNDPSENLGDDPSLLESVGSSPNLPNYMQVKPGLECAISTGYREDSVLLRVLAKPEHYSTFKVRDNLMYTTNRGGEEVLCIPHTEFEGDTIITMVIVQAHQVLGHLGAQRTVDYIHRWYWWPKHQEKLSSLGLLQVKVRTNFGSRGRGRESRGWPRLGITPGARETNWVQQQRSSVDPLHRFWLDRGNKGQE